MHRISKKKVIKGGFTLTEMVLVVAIILILASALFAGISDIINTTNRSGDAVRLSSSELRAQVDEGEASLRKYSFG
ncbi:MAG: type II secretion system GspH family protein [Saccharofermentans sp.]|nr:type II secretion system GspH family protein [Saccharofermentans sp.]